MNFSAGCESPLSNVVMAVAVLLTLELLTRLLYFTPMAILASIILAALPGLIDLNEARSIWRTDKLDFLACAGAFVGVLFGSVEIGLLVAVMHIDKFLLEKGSRILLFFVQALCKMGVSPRRLQFHLRGSSLHPFIPEWKPWEESLERRHSATLNNTQRPQKFPGC